MTQQIEHVSFFFFFSPLFNFLHKEMSKLGTPDWYFRKEFLCFIFFSLVIGDGDTRDYHRMHTSLASSRRRATTALAGIGVHWRLG